MSDESTLIYLFPGQGSQSKGMGEGLFEQFSELTETASDILGYSIQSLCLEDASGQLGQTQFTQPALYVVNALTYLKLGESNRKPDFVAGHSLGEYDALFAAGVFDFGTGLKLVQKRGELMSQASGGGMAAVIGMEIENIQTILDQHGHSQVSVANLNSPKQVVISGAKQAIIDIQPHFEEAGAKRYIPLKVSGAFHSPLMEPARNEFSAFLQSFSFNAPEIPVISNVTATPYPASGAAELLTQQITSSVRWVETIQFLKRQPNPEIEEVGPGKVLQGLNRQITI